jgi:2'-5' RNA ligase
MNTRAFLACGLDQPLTEAMAAKASLWRSQDKHSRYRWLDPASYHLTLCFLGELDAVSLNNLQAKLSTTAIKLDVKLTITELVFFPSLTKPKIIAVNLAPSEQLMGFQQRLCRLVRDAGIQLNHHRYLPHISVARAAGYPANLALNMPAVSIDQTWQVRNFSLFKSRLTPRGAVYTPLNSYSLV